MTTIAVVLLKGCVASAQQGMVQAPDISNYEEAFDLDRPVRFSYIHRQQAIIHAALQGACFHRQKSGFQSIHAESL